MAGVARITIARPEHDPPGAASGRQPAMTRLGADPQHGHEREEHDEAAEEHQLRQRAHGRDRVQGPEEHDADGVGTGQRKHLPGARCAEPDEEGPAGQPQHHEHREGDQAHPPFRRAWAQEPADRPRQRPGHHTEKPEDGLAGEVTRRANAMCSAR